MNTLKRNAGGGVNVYLLDIVHKLEMHVCSYAVTDYPFYPA